MTDEVNDKPLWLRRCMLILLSPILLAVALYDALSEGWREFWLEIKNSARDVRDIWRGDA